MYPYVGHRVSKYHHHPGHVRDLAESGPAPIGVVPKVWGPDLSLGLMTHHFPCAAWMTAVLRASKGLLCQLLLSLNPDWYLNLNQDW